MWWHLLVGVLAGVMLLWVLLVAALWAAKPDQERLREGLRLLPDVVRLLTGWHGTGPCPEACESGSGCC